MGDVVLSPAMRTSVAALKMMRLQMDAAQNRLATGLKVASALDNPSSFFTAGALKSRANDLDVLLTNMGTAQSTFTAASKGIDAIESLLNQASSVATSALQSAATLVTVTGTNTSALATNTTIATTVGAADKFKAGDTVQISDGTTTATYTAANNDTAQTFLDAVNNTVGLKVQASLNGSGQIQLSATAGVNVTISSNTAGGPGSLSSVLSLNNGTTTFTANSVRTGAAAQFDSLRQQIDQLAADAGFQGVNLLGNDSMTVTFNETGSSKLSMNGIDASSSGVGLSASSGQFQTNTDINTALSNISTALTSLRNSASSFSTNLAMVQARQDFTKSMINTLNVGADNLTAADPNEEGALLLALKSRQDMTAIGMSITQSADTAALRLLGING